jgi:hypothetical protein
MFTRIKSQYNYEYKCLEQKDNNYICNAGHRDFNIKVEFEKLSSILAENKKQLNRLEIHSSRIFEIPENAFLDISFDYLEIFEAKNLTLIHTNAFNSSTIRQRLFISKPSNLKNFPPNYDLYKALSSLSMNEFYVNIISIISYISLQVI